MRSSPCLPAAESCRLKPDSRADKHGSQLRIRARALNRLSLKRYFSRYSQPKPRVSVLVWPFASRSSEQTEARSPSKAKSEKAARLPFTFRSARFEDMDSPFK